MKIQHSFLLICIIASIVFLSSCSDSIFLSSSKYKLNRIPVEHSLTANNLLVDRNNNTDKTSITEENVIQPSLESVQVENAFIKEDSHKDIFVNKIKSVKEVISLKNSTSNTSKIKKTSTTKKQMVHLKSMKQYYKDILNLDKRTIILLIILTAILFTSLAILGLFELLLGILLLSLSALFVLYLLELI